MTKMFQRCRRRVALLCIVSMFSAGICADAGMELRAKAKKPVLSRKKVTLRVGKKATVKVKNAKKAKISWKSGNKKIATVKKKSAYSARITAKRTGNTKITATVKMAKNPKKPYRLSCKVKVKKRTDADSADEKNTAQPSENAPVGESPNSTDGAVSTSSAAATSAGTATSKATTKPTPRVTPTTKPTPKPTVEEVRVELSKENEYARGMIVDGDSVAYNESGSTYVTSPESSGGGIAWWLNRNHTPLQMNKYEKVLIHVKTNVPNTPVVLCLLKGETPDFWGNHAGFDDYACYNGVNGEATLEFNLNKVRGEDQAANVYGIMLKYDAYDPHGTKNYPNTQFNIQSIVFVAKGENAEPTSVPTPTAASIVVPDVHIDMSRVGDTTLTGGAKALLFGDQLDSRFNLRYYDSVTVDYKFEATDAATWQLGKLALAEGEQLNGYDDGVALTYGFTSGGTQTVIDVSEKSGTCSGLNVQPMTGGGNYGWPQGIKSITITGITFKAKSGAVYEEDKVVSLKDTYRNIFDYMGTCVSLRQLQDANTLAYVKKHYSSISLENEMKPDTILGIFWNKSIINTSAAKANTANYSIPDSYSESTIPELHYDSLDQVLRICKANGLKLRAHTLVWHSQTPEWFFKKGYDDNGAYVTKTVMNARMEMYIRSVMHHVYTLDNGAYKDVVYTWDVANEYLNNNANANWSKVYGNREGNLKNQPPYLKKAFEVAYDMLKKFNLQNSVSLVYNDFNTYYNANKVVELINYINDGESDKICHGIGMQSHLDVDQPTPRVYVDTVKKFINAGFEVQITELDATINNDSGDYKEEHQDDSVQAEYIKDLMERLVALQKETNGIKGLTLWGLYDSVSWRRESRPLLFGTGLADPKPSYYEFIDAAKKWNE